MARGRAAVQPLSRDGAVLPDPSRPADRPQQPHRRIRLSRGVLQRLPRLHGRSPTRLRSAAPGPARQRVQHRCVRQVAPHAGRPTGTGRPLRPVAERVGLRLLLRVPGRRREPVGPVHGREPEDHRNGPRLRRRGQPLLPARRHGRQDDPVAARSARAGRDQTVLRLLLHRVQPRATPRGRQLGREVQGSIRPGLGPHARGGVRAAATARGRSLRCRADTSARGVPSLGRRARAAQGVLRAADGGLRRVLGERRPQRGPGHRRDRRAGRARQHPDLLDLGRQRRQHGGLAHRLVQRADHAERHPAHRRDAAAARRALRGAARPGAGP